MKEFLRPDIKQKLLDDLSKAGDSTDPHFLSVATIPEDEADNYLCIHVQMVCDATAKKDKTKQDFLHVVLSMLNIEAIDAEAMQRSKESGDPVLYRRLLPRGYALMEQFMSTKH